MPEPKSALIVFAREPKDGKVKTRLCRDLPSSTVTRLYKAFIKDVLHVALQARCDERFIYYAGSGSSIPFLRRSENHFRLKRQTGKDLGERMCRAFLYGRKKQFERIVIIGTDCVTLTARDIEQAYQKLGSYDCVLGPSKDGGYYLIALKYPYSQLFKGIHWSTSSVLKQTLQKLRRLKKKAFLLSEREDIDTITHLKNLSRHTKNSSAAVFTHTILKNMSL